MTNDGELGMEFHLLFWERKRWCGDNNIKVDNNE